MSDVSRAAAVEGEAPVNPYSLMEAVNASSDTAHTAWLIFIAIMSYLLIAVAGVTHKDLLLSSDIPLPVLQVKIDLTRFFLFAPIVLVMFHLGVVSQLVMVARKTMEFDAALRMLEVSDKRTHPLRLELHNFFFVQAIAGPERSRIMSAFLHAMTWLTLAILPVVLLLYIQVVFLPYHDPFITWAHRIALACDIALLVLIGVFLVRPEASFLTAFVRMTRAHPLSFAVTFAVLLVVTTFSFLVATVPDEWLDVKSRQLWANRAPLAGDRAAYGFVMPFLGQRADGLLLGVFERNLNVSNLDLVVDKEVTPGEPSLNLRGRNLKYARLDQTDLHQSDLTDANLEGASLVGADLRGVILQCSDLNALFVNRADLACANARRANLTSAKLKDARLAGIDLRGAKLEEADLEGVDLSYAHLAGASFYGAHLEKADFTGGIDLAGANFSTAALQGADLTGARLIGANFTSAGLQGAILAHAYLHGARLTNADLEGANLFKARLVGANLAGAKIKSALLREAQVWQAQPPAKDQADLADLTDLAVKPLDPADLAELADHAKQIENERVRRDVGEALSSVLKVQDGRGWLQSVDARTWSDLAVAAGSVQQDTFKTRLTEQLLKLACLHRWANGSIATGLAKFAQRLEFRGSPSDVYDRLKSDGCPASKTVSRRAMTRLGATVDAARDN